MFVVKAWKKDILKDLGNDAQSGGLSVDFSEYFAVIYPAGIALRQGGKVLPKWVRGEIKS